MDVHDVPPTLRSALGLDAARGLLELVERSHEEARPAVTGACTERFERRLVEEISIVRVDAARESASLRQEIVALGAGLRAEMAEMGASLRQEISHLRAEATAGRVELFKWCFLFWIGQVIAIGGLLGVTVRLLR